MKSRTHISILGVQIPLLGLAYVTSTPPTCIIATIGSYEDRYSYSSPDIAEAIADFEKAPEHPNGYLPTKAGRSYQFFNYSLLTKPTPDLKPWE